jgi:hypothetical protein
MLKEIKYHLNIQFMNKALYNKFIVLLTSRLLQTNNYLSDLLVQLLEWILSRGQALELSKIRVVFKGFL